MWIWTIFVDAYLLTLSTLMSSADNISIQIHQTFSKIVKIQIFIGIFG